MRYAAMSYDLIGRMLGNAKRRAVELDWKLIGKRVGAGAAAAAVVAREKPELLTTRAGLVTLATTAAFGMIPFGAGAAGILTPIAPGLASLAGAALAAVTVPIAQRRQAVQDLRAQATQDLLAAASQAGAAAAQEVLNKTNEVLNKTNMDGIPAGQLGQRERLEDPLGQAAAPDAIAVTGGNQ